MNSSPTDKDNILETFWLSFKNSMINFYSIYKQLSRPLALWTKTLNDLQFDKNYVEIANNIQNYITLYSMDVMRINNVYHSRILLTNVKRFNKICDDEDWIKSTQNNNVYVINILLDIYENMIKKHKIDEEILKTFYQQIEIYIFYKKYNEIIIYCIEENMPSVLDKLRNIIDITNFINAHYETNFKTETKSIKMIKAIKKIKKIELFYVNNV
jgi:hypothetical protein